MAVRDLQVLNTIIDETDLDTDIQAWKDVGLAGSDAALSKLHI